MKKSGTLLAGAALLVVLLSGCTSTVNTVSRSDNIGAANTISDKRVVTDYQLGKAISILQVSEGMVSGNLTKVQVRLASNRSRAMNVNYAFVWYDLNGMEVSSSSSGWKSIRFQGKEEKAISSIGPNPNAVDFILKLQEAK